MNERIKKNPTEAPASVYQSVKVTQLVETQKETLWEVAL
jgi:hypothetical protein